MPLLPSLDRLGRRGDGLDLRRLQRLLGPDVGTVLEVGANDGADTIRLHRCFPGARLCAFEPDPRALARLRHRVRHTTVEVHPLAIGSHDGTAVFHQSGGVPPTRLGRLRWALAGVTGDGGWHRSGSIRPPTGHRTQYPWVTFDRDLTVDVQRLDTWAATHGVEHVDFIWADVQGAEIDLIDGGPATLARTRFLYTEFSDTPLYEGQIGLDDILARLPGWTVETLFSNDVLLRNTSFPTGR